MPIPAIFRAAVLPPDDLIIYYHPLKVNTSTEYIYYNLLQGEQRSRSRRDSAGRITFIFFGVS